MCLHQYAKFTPIMIGLVCNIASISHRIMPCLVPIHSIPIDSIQFNSARQPQVLRLQSNEIICMSMTMRTQWSTSHDCTNYLSHYCSFFTHVKKELPLLLFDCESVCDDCEAKYVFRSAFVCLCHRPGFLIFGISCNHKLLSPLHHHCATFAF